MPKTNKEEKVAPKSAAKAPTTAPVKSAPVPSPEKDKFSKLDFEVPDVKELLKAGVQFGHQISRWNPKMQKHIYTKRGNIHIINIADTHDNLEKALLFLANAASRGEVLFVGTKRQAREIIKETAIDAGAYYITHRWVGGLLTNYNFTDRSLKKLNKLEQAFETGVEGRTKFEVSLMKKEWERLNRLYEGVKALNRKPSAVVILDSKYERNVVREARILNIPIVAIVDTNADPEQVNYPIPGNDDALSAIKLYFDLFAKAVKQGNGGHGIKHAFKDYTKYEVAIKKVAVTAEDDAKEIGQAKTIVEKEQPIKAVAKRQLGEGILEGVQKAKETAQSNVVEEPVVVKAVAKKAAKVEKKAVVKETAAKKTVKVAKKAEKKPVKKVAKKPAKKAKK